MPYDKLPDAIADEVIAQQTESGWPEMVPKYAELPNGKFKLFSSLTVGECEQLVEHHIRKARQKIGRWLAKPNAGSRRAAGYNILRARHYRCQYITLCGLEETVTEADMPFPFMSEEEVRSMEATEGDG